MLAYLHFDLGLDLIVGKNGMFAVEVKVHGFATKDSMVGNHTLKAL